MPYRGGTKQWSNRWFFNQTALPSNSDKDAIADAIVAQENIQYSSRVSFVEDIWYAAGSDVPVYTHARTDVGTMATTGRSACPGDCAALLRFSTTQRTSKNHPIYLFKYFHDVYYDSSGSPDSVAALQVGRIAALGSMMVAGIVQAGVTYKAAGPHGAVAQGSLAEPLITHRDFPR
jgi:hypothetical protein